MFTRTYDMKTFIEKSRTAGLANQDKECVFCILNVDMNHVVAETRKDEDTNGQNFYTKGRVRLYHPCCDTYSDIHEVEFLFSKTHLYRYSYNTRPNFYEDIPTPRQFAYAVYHQLKRINNKKKSGSSELTQVCPHCNSPIFGGRLIFASDVLPVPNQGYLDIYEDLTQEYLPHAGFPQTVLNKLTQPFEEEGIQIIRGIHNFNADPNDLTLSVSFQPLYAHLYLTNLNKAKNLKFNENGTVTLVSQSKPFRLELEEQFKGTSVFLEYEDRKDMENMNYRIVLREDLRYGRYYTDICFMDIQPGKTGAGRIGLSHYVKQIVDQTVIRSHGLLDVVGGYLAFYKKCPCIEILAKANYAMVIYDIIRKSGRRLTVDEFYINKAIKFPNETAPHKILGVPKAVLKRLLGITNTVGLRLDDLLLISAFHQASPMNANDLDELTDVVNIDVLRRSQGHIISLLRRQYSYRDLFRYAERIWLNEVIPPMECFIFLEDYHRMCDDMNIIPERLPRYLRINHDITARNYQFKRNEMVEKQIKQRHDNEQYLTYEDENYEIILPTCTEDLVREGQMLNHCVASYVNRVAKGDTTIFFLRDRKHSTAPFYTIEWHAGRLVQAKGKFNIDISQAPEKVREFYKKWLKHINKAYKHYLLTGSTQVDVQEQVA